ncbi:hypothetical protein, partial [Prevotella pectinovora]|uniref:hypothetical protein n=1 Tax=Prevotella pectinovora TaxID=1602169 RepID=UPI0025968D98
NTLFLTYGVTNRKNPLTHQSYQTAACTPSCRKLELKHANTLSYQEIELFLQEITSYYTQQG